MSLKIVVIWFFLNLINSLTSAMDCAILYTLKQLSGAHTMSILNIFTRNKADDFKLPAWACAADVKARNKANKPQYTKEQIQFAEALFAVTDETYLRSKVYLNFRKNFVAVKVDAPKLMDKATLKSVTLDSYCEAHGITRVITKQGNIVYRATVGVMEQLTKRGLKAFS